VRHHGARIATVVIPWRFTDTELFEFLSHGGHGSTAIFEKMGLSNKNKFC